MRTAILLVLAGTGLPVLAQFSGLVTTTDGSQLYFSSKLRLHGSDQSDAPKIFHHGVGLDLVREVARDDSVPRGASNYYILIEPQVSGDGKTVGYTSTEECYVAQSTNCGSVYQTNVVGASLPASAIGHGRISPDGRYVATCCLDTSLVITARVGIFDLATGQSFVLLDSLVGDGLQAFADGGMLLARLGLNSVKIYHRNDAGWDSTPVSLSTAPIQARLSRDGSTILYASVIFGSGPERNTYQLVAHNIASGKETVLEAVSVDSASDPSNPFNIANSDCCFSPWISDDGKRALYLAPAQSGGPLQVFVQNTDGGARRLIANLPEGFNAITLSGNGKIAYAATPLGRLLRIDVETGATDQLSGPVPFITDLQPCYSSISCSVGLGAVAPGSVVWLLGSAFTANGEVPSVLVNGFNAPIFLGSESYLRIQIPWETPVNQRISFVVENGTPQPFESVKTENSAAIATNFLLASYDPSSPEHSFPALFHQDFSSLVTASQPASDGEFLHLYMTGLGPVSPAASTGELAPSREPLSRIVNPMTCVAFNSQAPVPVTFAGLAPGLTGIYQVDIQAPTGFAHAIVLTCTITDSSGTAHTARVSVP